MVMTRRPCGQRLERLQGRGPGSLAPSSASWIAGWLGRPSRRDRGRGVGGSVAEHGPEDVEASSGKGKHGLDMGFAFKAFAVVVGPGGGAGFQGREAGEGEDPEEFPVVAAGAVVVCL